MKISKSTLAFIFVILCLSQILYGFIYSDDFDLKFKTEKILSNSLIYYIDTLKIWCSQGRLTPLLYAIFILTTKYLSIFQYKIYLILTHIIALYSFGVLLKKLNPHFDFWLWSIFFFSLFQFQVGYHCAFNSFNGMYPLLLILISFSAINSIHFFENQVLRYKIYSVLCYFLALMIIEISYITPLILFSIHYFKTKSIKRTFLLNKEVFILTILFFSTSIFLKYQMEFNMKYSGIQSNFELKPILYTYYYQAFASLPLMYLYKQKYIIINILNEIKNHWIYLLTFLVVSYFFIKQIFKSFVENQKKGFLFFLVLGLILWLFPPIIISISAKYQTELKLGRGYLPLYIQNFGLATIIYYLFNCIKNDKAKKIIIICSFLIIFITLCYNFYLIEQASENSYRLLKEMNP